MTTRHTGPACSGCQATEQTCARSYPCCEQCSHFAEAEQPVDFTPDLPVRRQEPAMTAPTTIGNAEPALVQRARGITDKRITAALARYDDVIVRLRELIHDYDSKAEARREVERLEKQFADARAKLRGGSGRPRPASNGLPKRVDTPADCRKCGRTCKSAAGRASHERDCTGNAA